jgi:hypothetical protein
MAWGSVTPSHLGVTRGDHVSWLAMKIMIDDDDDDDDDQNYPQ